MNANAFFGALVLLIAGDVRAQNPQFADVLKWKGVVSGTGKVAVDDMPILPTGITTVIDYAASFSANIEVERVQADPPKWEGRIVGSTVTVHYAERLTSGTCTVEVVANASGPLDVPLAGRAEAVLDFAGSRGFTLSLNTRGRTATVTNITVCGDVMQTDSMDSALLLPTATPVIAFPATGLVLTGTATTKQSISSSPLFIGERDSSWDLAVSLSPDSNETLELVVEDNENYRQWRPETNRDGSSGPPLTLTATVTSSTGKQPQVGVVSFNWELLGTSQEPGLALNFPIDATDQRYDLELDADGSMFVLSANKQRVERATSNFSDSVRVRPFDWGGWAVLEVTAHLTDGRVLTGRIKGSGEDNIRIPKRASDSFIADRWRNDKSAQGADGSDEDSIPQGDGTPGDGLSLYEEYRGFYNGGEHIDGTPDTKELFLRNKGMFATLGGIAVASRASGLIIHHRLTDAELTVERVINGNHRSGPHVTAQHAVILEIKLGERGGKAWGGESNPKDIERLTLDDRWASLDPDSFADTVAHEIFHAVNVSHHGDKDYEAIWSSSTESFLETRGVVSTHIRQWAETFDYELTPNDEPATRVWIGARSGQHSGVVNCVMGYEVAEASIGSPNFQLRYVGWGGEFGPAATRLCSSPVGTSTNDPTRIPRSRFGDAAPGRGDCLHQILVTDAVVAPRRP